jgi:uncharacterized phage protein gp47/JayE
MTTYGLTAEGFFPKTLDVCLAEIEAAFQVQFGASINLAPRSFLGQLAGLIAEREALGWELDLAIYRAFDPDAAVDDALDAIAAITGSIRESATHSLVTMTMVGTPGTVLSAGRIVSVVTLESKFETLLSATITAAAAWTISTAYSLGQFVTNAGKVYYCITAGVSAGAGGPTTTATDITDGTVHWKFMGTGTGMVQVDAEAQVTGPIVAIAGTLSVIETPVGGWNSAINLLDAELGRDIESNADFRARRADEVTGQGNSTIDAIRAGVLRRVPSVTTCIVFQNTTLVTDGDGLPGKSVEVLVRGGDDQDILEAVFAEVSAGIETYGGVSGTVVDSAGNSHTVKFSRPTELDVYVVADVLKVAADFPADGEAQIKAALVALGDSYPIGLDVYANRLRVPVFAIAGVLNVTGMKIGLAPAPATEATIAATSRQLAVFDTSRITVNLSNGTP